jgi:diguanylate cyclase (GGDEF)-like protein
VLIRTRHASHDQRTLSFGPADADDSPVEHAPITPERSEVTARVQTELRDRARRLLLWGLPAGPSAGLTLTTLVDGRSRTAEVLFVLLMTTAYLASAFLLWRPLAGDTKALLAAALIGSAWGAAGPVLAPTALAEQSIVMLFLVGVAAVAQLTCSPSRWMYLAFGTPQAAMTLIWLATSYDDRLTSIAALSVVFFVMLAGGHLFINRVLVQALHHRFTNASLVVELDRERDRIGATNEALVIANERLSHRATHDALTGLLNRNGVMELVDLLAPEARPGASLVLLQVGIDRFKFVNDALGHLAGDRLLQAVAERVQRSIGDGAAIARLGGDEFAVVAHPVADDAEAVALADRVRAVLDDPVTIDGRDIGLTASIGVVLSSGTGETSADLLRFADAALHRAKDLGRNRNGLFDDSMRASIKRRFEEAGELRRAIDAGQIVPWYQPEVDLETGRIVGAEALARWIHPTRGVIVAGGFMPLAEEVGLDDLISDVIARGVIEQRGLWHAQGVDPSFRVRFNVTAQQIAATDAASRLLRAMERSSVPTSGLSIEVTETGFIRDLQQAIRSIDSVRAAGMTVALDDFGTGYSSMSLLQQLPIDAVKVDRSFIRDLADDPRDRALVRSVIGLAADLGLSVTAEGVETEEQADLLREMGCRRAQGFLYAAALDPDELMHRVRAAGIELA